MSNQVTLKDYFNKEGVKAKFAELLGKRSVGFMTSVMQVVNGNNYLQKASPESIYTAAAMAAALDLPINNNLGYAWIVPYGTQAQFQMGAKGYVQLAHRTKEYTDLNVIEVYKAQFISWNPLLGELKCDFSKEEDVVIGYYAFFKLKNGFFKSYYWTKEKVQAHGKRYSKSFSSGPWKDEFDKMAKKTVLKHLLKDWGVLSIEMQNAIFADQALINDVDTMDVDYVDDDSYKKQIEKPEFTELHFEQAYEASATIETIRNGYTTNADIEKQYNDYVAARNA